MAKKIIILTAAVIAAGAEEIQKAIIADAKGAADDIIIIAHSASASEQAFQELSRKFDTSLQTISDLQQENATLADINEDLTEEVERLSLVAKATADDLPEGYAKSFEHDGGSYVFNFHKIAHKGKNLSSAEVASDASLQKELVDMQSGMISLKD